MVNYYLSIKILKMKTNTLFFLLLLFSANPFLTLAQGLPGVDQSNHRKAQLNTNPQTGKFHIAIQDFSFGAVSNRLTISSFSLRAGYMITNKDMISLSGQYTWNPREGYSKAIETSLFYRRYFLEGAFQPFIQFGGGFGYVDFTHDYMNDNNKSIYGTLSGGTGVSFRYKRWGFELGIQSDFNSYSTGRFTIRPIVGVSFSF